VPPMPSVDEIVAAIQAKDVAAAEKLLAQDASLAHAKRDGGSMLMLAAYHRAAAIVDLLMRHGARPDVCEAAAIGRLDRVRELVNAGGLRGTSHDGWTPLHLAAHFGQKDVVAYLLAQGADVDARSRNPLGNTPLHAAAAGGAPTCVALLLRQGADPNAAYLDGLTALHVAASNGDDATARILLASKAEPDMRTHEGKSALDLAQEKGHERVARLLLQATGKA